MINHRWCVFHARTHGKRQTESVRCEPVLGVAVSFLRLSFVSAMLIYLSKKHCSV